MGLTQLAGEAVHVGGAGESGLDGGLQGKGELVAGGQVGELAGVGVFVAVGAGEDYERVAGAGVAAFDQGEADLGAAYRDAACDVADELAAFASSPLPGRACRLR